MRSTHLQDMFDLAQGLASKRSLRQQALFRKGVFMSKSLFQLSKDECDENLRKRRHGYDATVRLLETSLQ
jgi:hypothetical protein